MARASVSTTQIAAQIQGDGSEFVNGNGGHGDTTKKNGFLSRFKA
jgi:hypothetical protein